MNRACKENVRASRHADKEVGGDSSASGKGPQTFDGRENLGKGHYEQESKRDTANRIYRNPQ